MTNLFLNEVLGLRNLEPQASLELNQAKMKQAYVAGIASTKPFSIQVLFQNEKRIVYAAKTCIEAHFVNEYGMWDDELNCYVLFKSALDELIMEDLPF